MTLNIIAVQVGDYCGRGTEYIRRLFDGISYHLDYEYKAWCITDEPAMVPYGVQAMAADLGVVGWWNKISLFRPGILAKGERALYFDLDTVITGDLSDIADYDGKFAVNRDFYFKGTKNSAMMAWEVGAFDHIWRVWDRCGRPQFDPKGDQSWIGELQPEADLWQELYPGQVVSYKVDCQQGVPPDTRVVCFHGKPRPHEVNWLETQES